MGSRVGWDRGLLQAETRDNDPARMVESHETIREIFEALTGSQLVVVALRLDGLTMAESAVLLKVKRETVSYHLVKARDQIARNVPSMMGDVLSRKKVPAIEQGPRRYCVECGVLVSRYAKRCRPCSCRFVATPARVAKRLER